MRFFIVFVLFCLFQPYKSAEAGTNVALPGAKRDLEIVSDDKFADISHISSDASSTDKLAFPSVLGVSNISKDVSSPDFLVPDDKLETKEDFIAAIDLLSEQNRDSLAEILGIERNSGKAIYNQLGIDYSNAATALWARFVGRDITYPDILKAVALKMKVKTRGKSISAIEIDILNTEAKILDDSIVNFTEDDVKNAGFKVFEVLVVGSVGWEMLAAHFAWNYLDTDYKKLTNFITAFALMRRK